MRLDFSYFTDGWDSKVVEGMGGAGGTNKGVEGGLCVAPLKELPGLIL